MPRDISNILIKGENFELNSLNLSSEETSKIFYDIKKQQELVKQRKIVSYEDLKKFRNLMRPQHIYHSLKTIGCSSISKCLNKLYK